MQNQFFWMFGRAFLDKGPHYAQKYKQIQDKSKCKYKTNTNRNRKKIMFWHVWPISS